MTKISDAGYRFPPAIIKQAIWRRLRFTLSLRDVEDLRAERAIGASYETVRRRVNHFGPLIAAVRDLRIESRHERGRWKNDRVENSHRATRRREHKMQRFKSVGSALKFTSIHAAVYNAFNVQRHLASAQTLRTLRAAAMSTWREARGGRGRLKTLERRPCRVLRPTT